MENSIIEVKLSAPEVVEAIRFLAESIIKANALQAHGAALQNSKISEEDTAKSETDSVEKYEQLAMNLSPIKLEDLRKRLVVLLNEGRREQIRALINKYGGTTLTEVPEDKYGELLREAEKC